MYANVVFGGHAKQFLLLLFFSLPCEFGRENGLHFRLEDILGLLTNQTRAPYNNLQPPALPYIFYLTFWPQL